MTLGDTSSRVSRSEFEEKVRKINFVQDNEYVLIRVMRVCIFRYPRRANWCVA